MSYPLRPGKHETYLDHEPGSRWWRWGCICGAHGADFTLPYFAREAAAKYHVPIAAGTATRNREVSGHDVR
jgi:hypothetical protein